MLFLALSTGPGPAATPVALAQGLRQPILIHTVNPPRPLGGPIQDVGYCELATHPRQYDGAHLRLTALAEYEFEHFMLTDPSCGLSSFDGAIWVGFGGDVPSGAIYCCPGEGRGSATPSKEAEIPLIADGAYRRFRSLMEREGDTTIHATMIGTFLAKPEPLSPLFDASMTGYGHFGCCSLFVIERVEHLDDHVRADLDYSVSRGNAEGRACLGGTDEYQNDSTNESMIGEQRDADQGSRAWAFRDPERVAVEALRRRFGESVRGVVKLRDSNGRQVFIWRRTGDWATVVVTRPYWLSFTAAGKEVVWTAGAMHTQSCGFSIGADADLKDQIIEVVERSFGSTVTVRMTPTGVPLGRKTGLVSEDSVARFAGNIDSVVLSLAFNPSGSPAWVDVRRQSEYGLPEGRWVSPLYQHNYEPMIVFLDNLRPFGAPVGAPAERHGTWIQKYERAQLTWQEGQPDHHVRTIQAFSVIWN